MSNVGSSSKTTEGQKYTVETTERQGQVKCMVRFSDKPSQEELKEFAGRHAKEVTDLELKFDDPGGKEVLSFRALGEFPKLEYLDLRCVNVRRLGFNGTNMPVLKGLDISNLNCEVNRGIKLDLSLPELNSLNVEHTSLNVDEKNSFGLSLSRCPKLENFWSYKFWHLGGDNFMVLPECANLTLHRSDGTQNMNILRSPKLSHLGLRGCFHTRHVRLYDLPGATLQDVEALTGGQLKLEELLMRESKKPKEAGMPRCIVNLCNARLSAASKDNLRANPRLRFTKSPNELFPPMDPDNVATVELSGSSDGEASLMDGMKDFMSMAGFQMPMPNGPYF